MVRIRNDSFTMAAKAIWQISPEIRGFFDNWEGVLADMENNADRLHDKAISVQAHNYELFFIPLDDGSTVAIAAIEPEAVLNYLNSQWGCVKS